MVMMIACCCCHIVTNANPLGRSVSQTLGKKQSLTSIGQVTDIELERSSALTARTGFVDADCADSSYDAAAAPAAALGSIT